MPIKIALAGNPNSGKTTLFNALTGSNQFVGNWPGVTVEKKEGRLLNNKSDADVIVTDLPGVYSLSPYSPEETVLRNYLVDERPDAILNIVDGTNMERNLFLTTQLTELGIPVVVAINMMDVVTKNGDFIDTARLSKELGCRVTEISALKSRGIEEAANMAVEAASGKKTVPMHSFSGGVEHTLAHIEEFALHELPQERQRFYAIKLFERDKDIIKKLGLTEKQTAHIEGDIKRREEELEDDSESIIVTERYNYIDAVVRDCVKIKDRDRLTASEKIDRVVTNRFLALPIFAAVMFAVYFVSVGTLGAFLTRWTSGVLFGKVIAPAVANTLASVNCAAWLQGLILHGIVAGVGAVLGFVPQLLILFTFLGFLERCGYMSRIAFILDRVFRRFGLSGKSFIPILIGTGCGVPGIMAARTVENDRDRRMTIMTTTFIPCGAKLPVIALFSGALFGGAAWVAAASYFVGLAAIICSGLILKKTKPFAGGAAPFMMELPPYHLPEAKDVLRGTWERGGEFIRKAGTVILLGTVVIWFASNYGFDNGRFGAVDMSESVLAKIGGAVAFVFAPLGWGDWKAAVAMFTGLFAKENIVGTFGIFYGSGAELQAGLASAFTPVAGLSFLLFNLLCAPCIAAMSAIRREMNSAKWFLFAIGWQSALAYAVSLCVYRFGTLFIEDAEPGAGTIAALIVAGVFAYLLFRSPVKNRSGCSGCANCGACVGEEQPPR